MNLEGEIRAGGLVEVLLALGEEQKTGILTVQGEQEIIGISFLRGEVVSADALNQTLEEGLGEILASRGLIVPEDFSALAAEHQAGGGRVADLLVERSYLSRDELLDALRSHTLRLACQVMGWRSGEFKFYRGDEVSYEQGIQPIPVEELMLAAGEAEETGQVDSTLPSADTIFELRISADQLIDGSALSEVDSSLLPGSRIAEARSLLERIDGRRTAADLASQAGMPLPKVLLTLHQARQAGLVEPVTASIPSPGAVAQEAPPGFDVAPEPPLPPAAVERPTVRRSLGSRSRQRGEPSVLPLWVSRGLGLGLLAALFALLALQPNRFLFPFPWQGGMQRTIMQRKSELDEDKIDRAARVFFLLEGRFPDHLAVLVEEELLARADLISPGNRPYLLVSSPGVYEIQIAGASSPAETTPRRGTAAGNFLLDPEFLVTESPELPPLVLLD